MNFARLRLAALAIATLSWIESSAQAAATTVTVVGSLQSELGCAADWDPACASTGLSFDPSDAVWQGSFFVPAGSYDYKVAIDGSFDENYGIHAQPNGPSIALTLAAPQMVKFYYDDTTHWVADSAGTRIVVAPGSYQSEVGCPGDWQPDCLRSWLEDPDGDGVFELTTSALPAGAYELKIAIGEAWDENYGEGGVPGGANVPVVVPADFASVRIAFDAATNVPTVSVPEPRGAALSVVALAALGRRRRR